MEESRAEGNIWCGRGTKETLYEEGITTVGNDEIWLLPRRGVEERGTGRPWWRRGRLMRRDTTSYVVRTGEEIITWFHRYETLI